MRPKKEEDIICEKHTIFMKDFLADDNKQPTVFDKVNSICEALRDGLLKIDKNN
jgi:hypothetical protein